MSAPICAGPALLARERAFFPLGPDKLLAPINRGSFMTTLWLIVLCGVLAIIYAIWATSSVLRADAGSAKMQEIAAAVREGAQAYLRRQYTTIAVVGVVIFIIVGIFLGWLVAIGFAVGAILSGAAGFVGMNVSVRANVRTAQAAISSLAGGLELAFRAGAITGLLVAGLALLGVTLYFMFLTGALHLAPNDRTVVDSMVALGFGASLISIFARLGGGIFTKGADVGGDLLWRIGGSRDQDDDLSARHWRDLHHRVDHRHVLRAARRQPIDHGGALQGHARDRGALVDRHCRRHALCDRLRNAPGRRLLRR